MEREMMERENPKANIKARINAVKAVIFDLDGVLIDSVGLHCEAYKKAIREAGLDCDAHLVRILTGEKAEVITRKAIQAKGLDVSENQVKKIVRRKTQIYQEMINPNIIRPSARSVLETLRESGFRLALATGTKRENAERILEWLGFDFDAVVTADDVVRAKPDPEIYLLASGKLGLEPKECVAVDDAVLGIKSAKGAGALTIGFLGTFREDELRAAGADYVIDKLDELVSLLIS